jgi:mRNA interferase YafQ
MNGYKVYPTTRFKKDYKKFLKREKEMLAIQNTIRLLSENGHDSLPANKKPHKLTGNYANTWECHIFPDLLLIWEQHEQPNEIILIRVGSHSELF